MPVPADLRTGFPTFSPLRVGGSSSSAAFHYDARSWCISIPQCVHQCVLTYGHGCLLPTSPGHGEFCKCLARLAYGLCRTCGWTGGLGREQAPGPQCPRNGKRPPTIQRTCDDTASWPPTRRPADGQQWAAPRKSGDGTPRTVLGSDQSQSSCFTKLQVTSSEKELEMHAQPKKVADGFSAHRSAGSADSSLKWPRSRDRIPYVTQSTSEVHSSLMLPTRTSPQRASLAIEKQNSEIQAAPQPIVLAVDAAERTERLRLDKFSVVQLESIQGSSASNVEYLGDTTVATNSPLVNMSFTRLNNSSSNQSSTSVPDKLMNTTPSQKL